MYKMASTLEHCDLKSLKCTTHSIKNHQDHLKSLCRLCSGRLITALKSKKKNKRHHVIENHQAVIKQYYGIDVSKDVCSKHPPHFCHGCLMSIYNAKRNPNSVEYEAKKETINYVNSMWSNYDEANILCFSCTVFHKQARGGSMYKGPSDLQKDMDQSLDNDVHNSSSVDHIDIQCEGNGQYKTNGICQNADISSQDSYKSQEADIDNISNQSTPERASGRQMRIEEYLQLSVDDPRVDPELDNLLLTQSYKRHQTKGPIKLKTGGTPAHIVSVSMPKIPSSEASKTTLKRRGQMGDKFTDMISAGCSQEQKSSDLKRMAKSRRDSVLKAAGINAKTPVISANTQLAMKTELNLKGRQLRGLSKYLGQENVKLESEHKVRAQKRKLIGNHLDCEKPTFDFIGKDKKVHQKPKHIVFVVDLKEFTMELLDYYDSEGLLTWHDGNIPENQLWIKFGGDMGQKTIKFCLEVVNLNKPNSTNNTVILTCTEATDMYTNLVTMLERFVGPLQDLMRSQYKGKSIKLSGAGDIDLINKAEGMAGGNPKHPCYKCEISRPEMQISRSDRDPSRKRTLENLAENYKNFEKAGLKKSKQSQFFNVIHPPILPIEPDDWATPVLHCTIGEVTKLKDIGRSRLGQLDKLIGDELSKNGDHLGDTTFENYVAGLRKIADLETKVTELQVQIDSIRDAIEMIRPICNTEHELHSSLKEQAKLEKDMEKIQVKLKDLKTKTVLQLGDGPLVEKFDGIMDENKIYRELYYGGILNGNSCDQFLKVHDTVFQQLEQVIVKTAIEMKLPYAYTEGTSLCSKLNQVFQLRARVHRLISHADPISNIEIGGIQPAIDAYMSCFRQEFPEESIVVKQHLIEDHAVDDIRKYKFGLGMVGEQGFESIHHKFKGIYDGHCALAPAKRLLCSMQEHHLAINPKLDKFKKLKKS